MEKRLTKNEKGITLVALIITIIVLLILAVVSIRAITGDNILGKAETGKNKYEKARKDELDILKSYEKNIKFKIEEEDILKKAYINEQDENTFILSIEKSESGELILKGYGQRKDNNAVIEIESGAIKLLSNFDPISVEIDNKKIEINSNNAFGYAVDSRISYISERYIFNDVQDGGKYTENDSKGAIYTRNADYDKYINN